MNWAQIRQLYVGATGPAEAGTAEWEIHLNEGYRRVCARVDVRQLETTDESVTTVNGTDFSVLPSDVFAVIQVDNTTSGNRLNPEPSGMRGRSRYLDSDAGKPAAGDPQFYDVTADRIYWRPTPDSAYQMRIRYKRNPPAVSIDKLDESPLLPEHLHSAVALAAAVSFYGSHAELNEERTSGLTRLVEYQGALDKALQDPMEPKQQERFDQSGRSYMPGFAGFRTMR